MNTKRLTLVAGLSLLCLTVVLAFPFSVISLKPDSVHAATDPYTLFLPCLFRPCEPLYTDNFNDSGSGWPIIDDGDVLAEYTEGEYRMLLHHEDWYFMTRPGFQAADYIVSVELRNPNNVNGSYGIAFGIASDWISLYTLEIFPDGWYGIYRVDPEDFAILAEEYSQTINQGSAVNTIKIIRNGSSIEAYANGQLLTSVSDGTYTGTRTLGQVVLSYDDPNLDIRFDNFKVYPIDCSPSSSASFTLNRDVISHQQGFFSQEFVKHARPVLKR